MTTLAYPNSFMRQGAPFAVSEAAGALLVESQRAFEHFWATVTAEPIERQFASLAETWREERGFTSSLSELILSPAYQRVIGLGEKVVPFILRELMVRPDHWFSALRAITGADPVREEDAGNLAAMTAAWIEWGRSQGLTD